MAKIETVTFSIKTSDGTFETQVTIPMSAKPDVRNAAIENWLKMAQLGLSTGAQEMAATFPAALHTEDAGT